MPIGNRILPPNETTEPNQKAEIVKSFEPINPKYSFDDIILQNETKEEILNALAIKEKRDFVFNTWGLSHTHKQDEKVALNFYGPPGTGKTIAAHAVASHLGKRMIVISYADIESKYVGDTPKNLTRAFKLAEMNDCILFFDEADAILSRRVNNMNNATDTSVNQTRSVMLTLINDFKGIVIFATNYFSNYDPAFLRRIIANIEFSLPDYETRKRLFDKLVPPQLPTDANFDALAKEFEGISGSDIANTILTAAFKAARMNVDSVPHHYFEDALKSIQKSLQVNNPLHYKVERKEVSESYVKEKLNLMGDQP